MEKVIGEQTINNLIHHTSSKNEKKLDELSDKELDKVSGGVPGWWDYPDDYK